MQRNMRSKEAQHILPETRDFIVVEKMPEPDRKAVDVRRKPQRPAEFTAAVEPWL